MGCLLKLFKMDNKIKQRFVKDYNLPINIFNDEIFNYYIELYDFFPKNTWEKLCDDINNKYNGNSSLWLDYCAKVRDDAISGVIESDEYKAFNDSKNLLKEYNIDVKVGEHSLYSQETDGKRYVSIDLKKANFQALKFAGVLNDASYEDFIRKYGGDDYIVNSKYLRQVIFGKMNPGRTIKVEKYIVSKIHEIISPVFLDWKLFSFNSDELIYSLEDFYPNEDNLNSIVGDVKELLDIDVRAECVEIKKLPIVNVNGNNVDAYVRTNINTNESVLKKASTTFFPQIYKLWKGKEIQDKDLYVYFDDQLAKFVEPLRLV